MNIRPKLIRQIAFLVLFFIPSVSHGEDQCRVTSQSGSIDGWFCQNQEGNIRCYADVEWEGDSEEKRIYGSCAESHSDCWSTGDSAIDPCDDGDCEILNQSGSIDAWACRNSPHSIRCYADIKVETGASVKQRLEGSQCATDFSQCWSTGSKAFDPCD